MRPIVLALRKLSNRHNQSTKYTEIAETEYPTLHIFTAFAASYINPGKPFYLDGAENQQKCHGHSHRNNKKGIWGLLYLQNFEDNESFKTNFIQKPGIFSVRQST